MTNKQLHKIREAAIQLYKDKHYQGYDTEVQPTLCAILAFIEEYNRTATVAVKFTVEERQPYQPVDET